MNSVQGRRTERPLLPGNTQLAADGPSRSPVFCGDFLHDLDLEITLGNELLQPRILGLELLQAPDVVRLKATETLAPGVDRPSESGASLRGPKSLGQATSPYPSDPTESIGPAVMGRPASS